MERRHIYKGLDKNVERKELNMKLEDRIDWKTLQLIRDVIHTNGEHKSFDDDNFIIYYSLIVSSAFTMPRRIFIFYCKDLL